MAFARIGELVHIPQHFRTSCAWGE